LPREGGGEVARNEEACSEKTAKHEPTSEPLGRTGYDIPATNGRREKKAEKLKEELRDPGKGSAGFDYTTHIGRQMSCLGRGKGEGGLSRWIGKPSRSSGWRRRALMNRVKDCLEEERKKGRAPIALKREEWGKKNRRGMERERLHWRSKGRGEKRERTGLRTRGSKHRREDWGKKKQIIGGIVQKTRPQTVYLRNSCQEREAGKVKRLPLDVNFKQNLEDDEKGRGHGHRICASREQEKVPVSKKKVDIDRVGVRTTRETPKR